MKKKQPGELIRTRCAQGALIITDEYIRVQLGGIMGRQRTLYRASMTGIDSCIVAPSIFGRGGGMSLTFHGTGAERLEAGYVGMKDAQEIVGMFQHPQN
jgi:hypothetical protein